MKNRKYKEFLGLFNFSDDGINSELLQELNIVDLQDNPIVIDLDEVVSFNKSKEDGYTTVRLSNCFDIMLRFDYEDFKRLMM